MSHKQKLLKVYYEPAFIIYNKVKLALKYRRWIIPVNIYWAVIITKCAELISYFHDVIYFTLQYYKLGNIMNPTLWVRK